MTMKQGTITKIISNHYTIENEQESVVAIPRGKMRRQTAPVVGDRVEYEQVQDSYRIVKVRPRKNRLLRPAIANVDQALIVTSCKDPDFSIHLLNRLLILVSLSDVEPVVCLTKWDLASPAERDRIEAQLAGLQACGYDVLKTYPGSDDTRLREALAGKESVLCGQSGAGKSSLLNRLDPGFQLQTQEISKALGRGKHTTRFCQLHAVANGWVADTPGFSSLDFTLLDKTNLDRKIKAFAPYVGACRFSDCRHLNEPDCALKQAVEEGKVPLALYEDYKAIVEATPRKETYK